METIKNARRLKRLLYEYDFPEYFSNFETYLPNFELVQFYKNDFIYRTPYDRQYLFFFLSGKLKVCTNLSNGKSLLVCFYTSFEILGDLELFKADLSTNTIQAMETCLCIGLNITDIREQLFQDTLFLQFISKSLALKLSRSTANNSINILYPVENKLASYIYLVSDKMDIAGKQVLLFSENLTPVAELLGTSYRHLLRVLRSFTDKGILSHQSDYYLVEDLEQLKKLAQDLYVT